MQWPREEGFIQIRRIYLGLQLFFIDVCDNHQRFPEIALMAKIVYLL